MNSSPKAGRSIFSPTIDPLIPFDLFRTALTRLSLLGRSRPRCSDFADFQQEGFAQARRLPEAKSSGVKMNEIRERIVAHTSVP